MSRPGGWGLYLVDRIADRWGVVRNRMTPRLVRDRYACASA